MLLGMEGTNVCHTKATLYSPDVRKRFAAPEASAAYLLPAIGYHSHIISSTVNPFATPSGDVRILLISYS
jgi:hypothetical protein